MSVARLRAAVMDPAWPGAEFGRISGNLIE
jgi:hypothetical protein